MKHDTKMRVLFILLFTAIVMTAVFLATGCVRVKEVIKTQTVYDSASIVEKDSLLKVQKAENERLQSELRESQYSGIVFGDRTWPVDSVPTMTAPFFKYPCPPVTPNIVKINADGSIEASGNIWSATMTKDKFQRLLQEKQKAYDSLMRVKQKKETVVQWQTKTVEKIVKRGVPWWHHVLHILLLVSGYIIAVKWHSKIKLFIKNLIK